MEDKSGLTSHDFGKLLISSMAKIQAAQQIQAAMLIAHFYGQTEEKHRRAQELYDSDLAKVSEQKYEAIVQWLNQQAEREDSTETVQMP